MESGRYRAFISYSRADRDSARMLQRRLEGYVLPTALRVVKAGLRHDSKPLRPVFRDEDELVPGQDLPARIKRGLDEAEFLIVVCSPAAAVSEWVEKEVADFIAMGKGADILAIVVAGEPTAQARGLDPALECLPPSLRAVEPLWIDWRNTGAKDRANFLRLVAALLHFESLDQLIQRDKQARRRRRLITGLASAVVVIGAAVGGWIGWNASLGSVGAQSGRLDHFLHIPDPERDPQEPGPESVKYTVLLAQDLTGDNIVDFIIYDESWGKCGSGGCQQGLYIGNRMGGFRYLEDWMYNGDTEDYVLIPKDGARDNLLVGRMRGGDFIFPFYTVFDENKATGEFDLIAGWFCGSSTCTSFEREEPAQRVEFIPFPPVDYEAGEEAPDPCPAVSGYGRQQRPPMYISPVMQDRSYSNGTERSDDWFKVNSNWQPSYFGTTADGRWHAYVDYKLAGVFYVKASDCPAAPPTAP